jgi:hypothetical protein
VTGSLVAIAFGSVFVLVNSADSPSPWPLVIRALAAVVVALLAAGLVRVLRTTRPAPEIPASEYLHRRYWLVVILEAVALFGGLSVVNGVLDRAAVSVAWVALVVGVHFFALAAIWRTALYHWLGATMTALGVAGFVIYAVGGTAVAVDLVAGVGSGAALYGAVAVALRGVMRGQEPADA